MSKLLNSIRRRFAKTQKSADFMEIERAERVFYLEILRENMLVFDVGANVGEMTLIFSRFAREVHSFEASKSVFEKLKTICAAAECSNVALNHLAVSDQNGTIRLHVYDNTHSGFNSQAARPLKNYGLDLEPVGIEETPATTIDDYCETNKIETIDLLKIDVEGGELQVLRGARKMLETKRIRCLTFEFGQTTFDMKNRPEEIEKFLKSMNYQIRNLIGGDPTFPGRESVETARYSMHIAVPEKL